MKPSEAIKELVKKWENISPGYDNPNIEFQDDSTFISDLTALISEGYVEKAKYDEAVRQRDELREALVYLMEGVRGLPPLTAIVGVLEQQYIQAEVAIKNTER